MIWRPSPNFDERPAQTNINYIILHYTDMDSAEVALERLSDPASKVSAHFLIGQDGALYKLVDPLKRAWHAGLSSWKTERNLNDVSIGIELDHPGHKNLHPYTSCQMEALYVLLKNLCCTYNIDPQNVWGHSDIAPTRKIDPGEFFDWKQLYARGFGQWVDEAYKEQQEVSEKLAKKRLEDIGYVFDQGSFNSAILAFQRHFYPKNVTGALDQETFRRMGAFLSKKQVIHLRKMK